MKRILLSASKQSLKGAVPQVDEALPLRDLIRSYASAEGTAPQNVLRTPPKHFAWVPPSYVAEGGTVLRGSTLSGEQVLKLICCCYEGEEKRVSIGELLAESQASEIVILIGPEGDFSREEVALALECGFRPVHLGPSRLRTETAALAAVAAVYFHYCGDKGM
ncbi:MAG: RNA methyltransferase [Bacteroidales bacterium]|nr:RNA methyltransferase [Bacteroidales bacterium]